MKKMMILAVMMTAGVCAQAQSDKSPVNAYFTTGEMPDMVKWCPAPPDTTSAQFAYDITQYCAPTLPSAMPCTASTASSGSSASPSA